MRAGSQRQESTPSPPSPRWSKRGRRAAAVAGALGVHGGLLAVLLLAHTPVPKLWARPPIELALLAPPRLAPPADAPKAPSAKIEAAAPRSGARPRPAQNDVTLAADRQGKVIADPGLNDGDLLGAATADSGAPGGVCNMVRRLQTALRKDQLVQAAARAPGAAGKALMVWNGDWVMNAGEDGKGLAAVREAILWEVAFAPLACRTQPMHGLVVISLNDAPGSTRLAVGAQDWRWADLLSLR